MRAHQLGLIVLTLLVLVLGTPLWGDQLINPGFESGITGWSLPLVTDPPGPVLTETPSSYTGFGTTVTPTEGQHFLWLKGVQNNYVSYIYQSLLLNPGESVSGYYRGLSDNRASGLESRVFFDTHMVGSWASASGSIPWTLWQYTNATGQAIQGSVMYEVTNLTGINVPESRAVAFFDTTSVPEPMSLVLGLCALGAGLGLRRRRAVK
jgi:MYXO-CTERM domain-containing protein